MNVTLNEDSVRRSVESLARKYNTYGNTRDFHTTAGNIVQVSGGNYGWILNKSGQTTDLIESIKKGESGKVISKEILKEIYGSSLCYSNELPYDEISFIKEN